MKTKLFFGMLTAAATLAVAPAVFADVTTGTISKEYQRGDLTGSYFTGTSYTTTGEETNYSLTLPGGNVYFTGDGTLTIASITGTGSSSGTVKTHDAFIVEGTTVILNGTGVNVSELGMNLCIGTMEDATLKITGGAKVTTGAYLSTVGANLATGTIIIDGEGSTLATQQITLGSAVDSLTGIGESSAADGDYWTRDIITDDYYKDVLSTIAGKNYDPTKGGSYGIVTVTNGGKWTVGVGNTDSSTNKLQLSNGEINISGSSSELVLGSNSSLLLMGESYNHAYGIKNSETVSVTGGGKISSDNTTETKNGTGVMQLILGYNTNDSKDTVSVSAEGAGSSFDVYVGNKYSSGYIAVYIGAYDGDWAQKEGVEVGTVDVDISASNGGEVKISTEGAIVVAADNCAAYIADYSSEWGTYKNGSANSSHGLTVAITAEVGENGTAAGTVVLDAAGDILLAAGAAAEGYSNSVTITADGTTENGDASSVTISGANIYSNKDEANNVSVEITATNGGTIALSAAKVENTGNGVISFGLNTQVTVEKGSSLTTEGIISFESGSSISVDATSKWTTESSTSVTFNEGSGIEIGAVATDNGDNAVNIAVGSVTISESASISVYVDVSALSDDTLEFTVNLMTGTFEEGFNASNFSSANENLFAKFSDETNWAYEYGLALDSDSGTLQLEVSRTYLPEPSMFGMLFGLSALGLVSTRRRRRKA